MITKTYQCNDACVFDYISMEWGGGSLNELSNFPPLMNLFTPSIIFRYASISFPLFKWILHAFSQNYCDHVWFCPLIYRPLFIFVLRMFNSFFCLNTTKSLLKIAIITTKCNGNGKNTNNMKTRIILFFFPFECIHNHDSNWLNWHEHILIDTRYKRILHLFNFGI